MKKQTCIIMALSITLTACGSTQSATSISTIAEPIPSTEASTEATTESTKNSETHSEELSTEAATTEAEAEEPTAPTKEEVEAKRAEAVQGMREEAVSNMSALIKNVDRGLEYEIIYDNLYFDLKDPDSLTWGYWDTQGDFQIGWAYDGDIDKDQVMKDEGLTEDQFNEKYGQPVMADSELGADEFASRLETWADMAENQAMRDDLTTIATEARKAKETHDVEHVQTMYEYLHDLDYWVLNYRVDEEMTQLTDTSTLLKYYGVLKLYQQ